MTPKESLKFLTNKADDLCQSMSNKIMVVHASSVLEESIKRQEEYGIIHDLRSNPDDLPELDKEVVFLTKDKEKYIGKLKESSLINEKWNEFIVCCFGTYYTCDCNDVIAWRYSEPFEGEVE